MKPTFEKTVDVLVKAYLNDTLQHEYCSCLCCRKSSSGGVGNQVSKRKYRFDNGVNAEWRNVAAQFGKFIYPRNYRDQTKLQIDATGYSWQQLIEIERAFELAPRGYCEDEWNFNGLMAVVDVLADIHGVDLEKKEAAKALFVKV